QRLELLRLGYRPFAGKTLADVCRGVAVDGRAALEQRHAVPRAAREHEVRAEAAAHDPLERRDVLSDERHLLDRREVEVERLEQVRERLRVLEGDLVKEPEDTLCPLLVLVLARQQR